MPRAAERKCGRIIELTIRPSAGCAPAPAATDERAVDRPRADASHGTVALERASRWAAKSARRPAMRAAVNGRRIQETKNMQPRSINVGRSLTMATVAVALAACSDN